MGALVTGGAGERGAIPVPPSVVSRRRASGAEAAPDDPRVSRPGDLPPTDGRLAVPRGRLPAGTTASGRPSGDGGNRATRLQPNVARAATDLVQSTHPSVQQPHGDGRSGRPTGESPTEGSGLPQGGTPWGGQGAAKGCAGLVWSSDGDFSGGTDDPGRRTFRSLETHRPPAWTVSPWPPELRKHLKPGLELAF